MKVYISTDCGGTYNLIYNKGGNNLQTHDTLMTPFYAMLPHHWRTDYVDITSYAGNDVLIKFQTYNKSGNNLYLDNIWVYEGAEPVGIKENELSSINISEQNIHFRYFLFTTGGIFYEMYQEN